MSSQKKKKAQDLNLLKGRIVSSVSLMRKAIGDINKYELDISLSGNLRSAKCQMLAALGKWDKEVWDKED
jgi:hypothetical protein